MKALDAFKNYALKVPPYKRKDPLAVAFGAYLANVAADTLMFPMPFSTQLLIAGVAGIGFAILQRMAPRESYQLELNL